MEYYRNTPYLIKRMGNELGLCASRFTGVDRIVTFRNKIAHGENSIIPDTDSIEKYISFVTEATDIFLQEIDGVLSNQNHLHKAA